MKANRIVMIALSIALLLGGGQAALAAPYDSYNYSYWTDAVPAPASYLPDGVIDGERLGVGEMNNPQDMTVGGDGRIYIADTGNKRIIIAGKDWRVERVIDSFERDGKKENFQTPNGVYVTPAGEIYVADSEGGRVVVLDNDGTFNHQISDPKSEVLPQGFAFNPVKVAVDAAERVYVVAKGVFEGIMQFDSDGSFIGYLGTNAVTHNFYDYFWKMVSTKAQRAQMALFVPTEFTNLDIDDINFVLATNIDKNSDQPVKRLNPSGKDVLKRFGYFPVRGDLYWSHNDADKSGPSVMTDIASGPDGTVSALDSLRGRVFTYDDEGNLLYIFGQSGTIEGTFKTPVALERSGDRFLVLDGGTGGITVFKPTTFGGLINRANRLHAEGKDQDAAALWRQVLSLDANYDLAYIGIGKSLLRDHQYKDAMHYFKLGMNRQYYSTAYALYRKQWLREHFGSVLTGVVVLAMLAFALRIYRKVRTRRMTSRAV